MPSLVCSVQNCAYNNAMYCSKGDITIGGAQAEKCQETCCESFVERKADSAKSSMGSPQQEIQVECQAHNCTYNQDCRCQAGKVTIAGAGACHCKETECVTFAQER